MAFSLVVCSYCSKDFLKDNRHINENLKLGQNFYCSLHCQIAFKSRQKEYKCANPKCNNVFKRSPHEISPNNFCSRSCTAIINNSKYPKRQMIKKICNFCKNIFTGSRKKYCSYKCQYKSYEIPRLEVITQIKNFYKKWSRIPVKREFKHYHVARRYFGTWNKAIEAVGYKPNPILFAEHQIARDGHICDSLAEKLIDDYLHIKGIIHQRHYPYPEGIYTADFKIGNIFIEYFGLAGEHKRYDELKNIKQNLIRKYKLQILEIYPKDLYPNNHLKEIFGSFK